MANQATIIQGIRKIAASSELKGVEKCVIVVLRVASVVITRDRAVKVMLALLPRDRAETVVQNFYGTVTIALRDSYQAGIAGNQGPDGRVHECNFQQESQRTAGLKAPNDDPIIHS